MINEVENKIENEVDWDYLYESERDDIDIKKMEKMDKNALKLENEGNLQVNDECFYCGLEFPVDDMDRKDGEWCCRSCEERK